MNADKYDEWKLRVPKEYDDGGYCGECKHTPCHCAKIERADMEYDSWKDEEKK